MSNEFQRTKESQQHHSRICSVPPPRPADGLTCKSMVLGPGPVTGDKLHAAVAAYILTALLRDAPSAAFFAWRPDWRRTKREIRRAPLRFRITNELQRRALTVVFLNAASSVGAAHLQIAERERDKPMSYPTTIGRGRSGPVAAMSLTLLLLAGCTSVSVDREVGAMEQLPPPDRVLVYNFAVTPHEVQLDAVGSAITQTFDGTADSQQEQQVGHAVANALAKRLVSDIPSRPCPGPPRAR